MNPDRNVIIPLLVCACLLLAASAKSTLLFAVVGICYIFYFLRTD